MRKILFIFMCVVLTLTFCACTANKDFSYVYPWAKNLKVEDIDEIKVERGYYGDSPARLKNIYYSTDENDIKSVCSLFDKQIKRTRNEGIDGGGYYEYTLFSGEKTYTFRVSYSSVIEVDGMYNWELVSAEQPTVSSPYLIGYFLKAPNECKVYSDKDGRNEIGSVSGWGKIEFTEAEEKYSDDDVKYYIDLGYRTLGVVDKEIFIYGNETYKMLSDIDLSAINYYR